MPVPPASQPPQGGSADDMVDVTMTLPRSQLGLALEVVGQLAAVLQAASDQVAQADAPAVPGGPGMGEPAPTGGNDPASLLADLQGR